MNNVEYKAVVGTANWFKTTPYPPFSENGDDLGLEWR